MNRNEKLAITAIRDIRQEAQLSKSLLRIGWKIAHRATSVDSLVRESGKYPHALLLVSDDFGRLNNLKASRILLLRGLQDTLTSDAMEFPTDDAELIALINSDLGPAQRQSFPIPKVQCRLDGFLSIGRGVGNTVNAISAADIFSSRGEKVLLTDGNFAHPNLSTRFDIRGIRDSVNSTSYGLSLRELTDLSSIINLVDNAENFDHLIIDMGQVMYRPADGRRREDALIQLLLNSGGRVNLTASPGDDSITEIKRFFSSLTDAGDRVQKNIFISTQKLLSQRDRNRLKDTWVSELGIEPFLLSWDSKGISRMEEAHSTLSHIAPRSLLLSDFSRYLEEAGYS